MKKIMGLGAMLLAGLLVIPGNLWLASRVLAQSGSKTIEDKQMQELQQKRQEEGLGARLLAGFLVIPGNLWLASRVLAQSGSKTIEDKQMQELQQKRQEEWQE